MEKTTANDFSMTAVMSRSPEEIARVLSMLLGSGQPLRCNLAGGELLFESRLLFVDPARAYILLGCGADERAASTLLERPRAMFHATPGSAHIEFAAAGPQRADHEGGPAIRLRFPEILVTQQRRSYERISLRPQVPLKFVADAGGPLSFVGAMVDISAGGLGFMQYASDITLEPGTILKDSQIELPGRAPVIVDLEVRYSCILTQSDGSHAIRSGCRFINTTPELRTLLESFFEQ
jgi:c-di-GMP-binding flagellar brake protein YcgR